MPRLILVDINLEFVFWSYEAINQGWVMVGQASKIVSDLLLWKIYIAISTICFFFFYVYMFFFFLSFLTSFFCSCYLFLIISNPPSLFLSLSLSFSLLVSLLYHFLLIWLHYDLGNLFFLLLIFHLIFFYLPFRLNLFSIFLCLAFTVFTNHP